MTTPVIKPLNAKARRRLIDEARLAAKAAYAPYSNFHVGAAVQTASGAVFRGANIENASFGLTICAERVALATAKMASEQIVAIAVACVDAPDNSPLALRSPCGACRQWIQELAADAEILIAGPEGTHQVFHIADLLPFAFTLHKSVVGEGAQ